MGACTLRRPLYWLSPPRRASMLPRSYSHVPHLAFRVFRLTAAAYLLAGGALYLAQDSLLLVPGPPSEPRQNAALTPDGDYFGEVHEPSGPARGTVVFFHGNAGTVADRSYAGQPVRELGYRVVLVEYPGFGARKGSVDVGALGKRSVVDFDLVREAYPDQPLIVAGESFGAGMAAAVAGARPAQVCAAVLHTPWNRLSDLVQEKLPMFPAGVLLKESYPSDRALQDYRGPVPIVGAELDTLIPVRHARTLARRHAGSTFDVVPGAGHNDWPAKVTVDDWRRWLAPNCSR